MLLTPCDIGESGLLDLVIQSQLLSIVLVTDTSRVSLHIVMHLLKSGQQFRQILTFLNLLRGLGFQMVDLLPDEGEELQHLVLHLFLDIDFVNLLELVAPLVKGLVFFLEPSVNLLGDLRHEDWLLSVDVSLIDALLAEGLPLVWTLSSLERYDR